MDELLTLLAKLTEIGPIFLILLGFIGLFIMVLWILLPFAVFGVKKRLTENNFLLEQIFLQLGGEIDNKYTFITKKQ